MALRQQALSGIMAMLAISAVGGLSYGSPGTSPERDQLHCQDAILDRDRDILASTSTVRGHCVFEVDLPPEMGASASPATQAAGYIKGASRETDNTKRRALLDEAAGPLTVVLVRHMNDPMFAASGGGVVLEQKGSIARSLAECSETALSGETFKKDIDAGITLSCQVDGEKRNFAVYLAYADIAVEVHFPLT